jgi:hypothetical protein
LSLHRTCILELYCVAIILLSYSLNTSYFKRYNTSSLYSSRGIILLTNLSLNFTETTPIFMLVLLTDLNITVNEEIYTDLNITVNEEIYIYI